MQVALIGCTGVRTRFRWRAEPLSATSANYRVYLVSCRQYTLCAQVPERQEWSGSDQVPLPSVGLNGIKAFP